MPSLHPSVDSYLHNLETDVHHNLSQMGYLPPAPPPFLRVRIFETVAIKAYEHNSTAEMAQAIDLMQAELNQHYHDSHHFLKQIQVGLQGSSSFFARLTAFWQGWDAIVDSASLSIYRPEVAQAMQAKMDNIEKFLVQDWATASDKSRGVLAIHVDEANQQTIVQMGTAAHGVLYITIPKLLNPQEVAERSIKQIIGRVAPFRHAVDPMAVINGDKLYHGLNFGKLFNPSRVIRAPSGNIERLQKNIDETATRPRLETHNTMILNSIPTSEEEYKHMAPPGYYWAQWRNEAPQWNATITGAQFASAPVASRETFLAALAQAQNVIVLVAHCEEQPPSIWMVDPRPTGTKINAQDLYAHQAQIAANSPFVYLLSCEAGKQSNLNNFATVLLECGAAGVVASQTPLPTDAARPFLARLLAADRTAPPLEHLWQSIKDEPFFEMEVFLA